MPDSRQNWRYIKDARFFIMSSIDLSARNCVLITVVSSLLRLEGAQGLPDQSACAYLVWSRSLVSPHRRLPCRVRMRVVFIHYNNKNKVFPLNLNCTQRVCHHHTRDTTRLCLLNTIMPLFARSFDARKSYRAISSVTLQITEYVMPPLLRQSVHVHANRFDLHTITGRIYRTNQVNNCCTRGDVSSSRSRSCPSDDTFLRVFDLQTRAMRCGMRTRLIWQASLNARTY